MSNETNIVHAPFGAQPRALTQDVIPRAGSVMNFPQKSTSDDPIDDKILADYEAKRLLAQMGHCMRDLKLFVGEAEAAKSVNELIIEVFAR